MIPQDAPGWRDGASVRKTMDAFSCGTIQPINSRYHILHKSQLLLLGKVESGGGPIFKVVVEC